MDISNDGLKFIENRENIELKAMKPLKTDVWTIGFGHTEGVKEGDTCTLALAVNWLHSDAQKAVNAINRFVTCKLTQAQFDALVSLVFNVGTSAFFHSRALTRLNSNDIHGFCDQAFSVNNGWVHSGGVLVTGLVNRRKLEQDLFLNGHYA